MCESWIYQHEYNRIAYEDLPNRDFFYCAFFRVWTCYDFQRSTHPHQAYDVPPGTTDDKTWCPAHPIPPPHTHLMDCPVQGLYCMKVETQEQGRIPQNHFRIFKRLKTFLIFSTGNWNLFHLFIYLFYIWLGFYTALTYILLTGMWCHYCETKLSSARW